MDDTTKKNLLLLLEEAKNEIYEFEYSRWLNIDTMMSFDHWRPKHSRELSERIDNFLSTHLNKE